MPRDQRTNRDGAGRHDGAQRSALLGALVAVPVLAVVVIAAGAARPPATSDGVWTTPLQVVLGVAAIAALVVLVLVVRGMEVDGVRPPGRPRGRSRMLIAFALLVVAIVAVPQLDLDVPPVDSSPFSFGPAQDGAPGAVDPLPVSPTAVVAGLAALALAGAGGVLLLRGGHRTATARRDPSAPDASPSGPPPALPPDGPPDHVVLAAYAAARREAIHRLGVGEHDPPGRLVRRAEGTAMAAALREVTGLYLPVRYGRRPATAADADAAVAALQRLRSAPHAAGRGG